eukprot:SAG31_NODE_10087_length_1185_cov_1.577348_1_plen_61_part_10
MLAVRFVFLDSVDTVDDGLYEFWMGEVTAGNGVDGMEEIASIACECCISAFFMSSSIASPA